MKTAAIICEYNPFHNGHKYHIEQTRLQHGATHIVCVMSGNFTQRGDVALADKYARARAALMGGADLVVELPTPFGTFCYGGLPYCRFARLCRYAELRQ